VGLVTSTGLYRPYLAIEKVCLLCGWVWGSLTDCRYGRGIEKGVGLDPKPEETDFLRLQQSHFSGSACTGYIYQNEDEAEGGVLGYDIARYPSCPGLWWCIISQTDCVLGYDATSYPRRILPCVMMLHPIPEEHHPQRHSCDNFRTQKIRNLNVAIIFYFLLQ